MHSVWPLIIAAFLLLLGCLSFLSKDRNHNNILFFLTCLFGTGWVSVSQVINLHLANQNLNGLLIASRISIVFAIFLSNFIFLFNYHLSKNDLNKRLTFSSLAISILFSVFAISGLFIKSFSIVDGVATREFTQYVIGLFLLILTYIFLGVGSVVKNTLNSDKSKNTNVKLNLTGIILGFSWTFFFAFILPLFGINQWFSLGYLGPLIFLLFAFFAVTKYEFLNVQLIITKGVATLLAILPVLSLFYATNYFFSDNQTLLFLLQVVQLIFWLLYFDRFQLFIQTPLEKKFLAGKFNYKKTVQLITTKLTLCQSVLDLYTTLQDSFIQDIEISSPTLFIPKEFEHSKYLSGSLEDCSTENKLSIDTDLLTILQDNPDGLHNRLLKLQDMPESLRDFCKSNGFFICSLCYNKDKNLIAALFIGKKLSGDTHNEDDIDMIKSVSQQLSLALMRIRQFRVSAEMDVAQRIQLEILPKNLTFPGLNLSCFMQPADEVGGDYYDVTSSGDYSWIVLGDVAGHGVASGLVMFMVQSIMSTLIKTNPNIAPGELNYLANEVLYENLQRLDDQRPMTVVTICSKNGRDFSICGSHDNILIYRKRTKKVQVMSVDQIPFGIGFMAELDKEAYKDDTFRLNKGDILLIATDGIAEAAKEGDYALGQYGEERIAEKLLEHCEDDVDTIKEAILEDVQKFSNGIFFDDVTIVIGKAV